MGESGGHMQKWLQAVQNQLISYRKRGFTHSEALEKILNKMIKKRDPSEAYSTPVDFDQELINKVRKQSGMNYEETVKTLQLKRELDRLLELKMHQESCSSEESADCY